MNYVKGSHNFKDSELVNGKDLAAALGVSGAAISKATNPDHPRIDTYENSKGRKMFHAASVREQFFKNRNPSKITTATRGQREMGLTDFGARVIAQQREGLTADAVRSGAEQRPMTDEEAYDFAESRAKRENFAAEIAKMKALETAGNLVDKAKAGAKISELANSVKDRLLSLHIKVAGAVIGPVEKALVAAGVSADDARVVISSGNIEAVVGETIRKEIVNACRDIVEAERMKLD